MPTEENKVAAPKVAKSPAKKPAKKKNFFVRSAASISKWFRELRSEMKKVVWPTPKQIINNTLVALLVMIVSAIVVWGFDEIASTGVSLLITAFK